MNSINPVLISPTVNRSGCFLWRRFASLSIVCLAVSHLVACATIAEAPKAKMPLPSSEHWPALAKARAEARWAAMAKNDYDGAFAYFTEASRKSYDASMLRASWSRLSPKGGSVSEPPVCDQGGCVVTVQADLTVSIPRVGFKQQIVPMMERWVAENDDFYLIRH